MFKFGRFYIFCQECKQKYKFSDNHLVNLTTYTSKLGKYDIVRKIATHIATKTVHSRIFPCALFMTAKDLQDKKRHFITN